MTFRKLLIIGLLALSGCALIGAQSRAETTAPDFSLKDTNGNTVTLSSLRGKVVFLDFWASWCPPCRMSIPKVQQLHERFKGKKVVVLGINVENNAKTAANFAKKENLGYTVLVGNDKVEKDYRISSIPGFFIIDTQGRILKKYAGYFPGMENEWDNIINQALGAGQKGTTGSK